jgi:predicted DCC family thiol-disulfide oxidoreductase YuxK
MQMKGSEPVVLFDGVCNFCNGSVNFLISNDREKKLRFAPLQSEAGQALLQKNGLPTENFGSFVLIHQGRVYQQSTAALQLISFLPWYWQWAKAGWILPRFIRDSIYNLIARNRYKWFGKKDACMVPAPDLKERFLT